MAVTEATPVRDILIELARKAEVDLELDPRISGGIIMTATDRPFVDVIERIADLAELRVKLESNTLKVEVDDPYLEQYRMDILNLSRSATSTASSSTDASSVAQAVGSGSSGGGDNGSSTTVSTETRSAFWDEIGANLDQILNGVQSRRQRPMTDMDASFVPEADDQDEDGGEGSGGLVGQAAGLTQGRQAELDAILAEDQVDAPVLRAGDQGDSSRSATFQRSNYGLNPQAGIITVFATQRQQVAVEKYLKDVRAAVGQQVLIEAKVVEVTLSDQYRAGVNWNAVFGPNGEIGVDRNNNLNLTTNFTRDVVPPDFTGPTVSASWLNGGDLSLAVQLVKQFGTVRTLSSPRLTALNNQVAQLKVARNQVFFEIEADFTESTNQETRDRLTIDSNIKTVPIGLIMSVQPAVDPISKRVTLNIRPSLTRITGFINDPSVAITISLAQQVNASVPQVSSPIPIIEVREMDSLVTMDSGETVVLGGLMREESQNIREGLPGAMDFPLLGQAVSQNIRENEVTELVIFIRATLVDAEGTISDEDIRLYKNFTPDPRPIVF